MEAAAARAAPLFKNPRREGMPGAATILVMASILVGNTPAKRFRDDVTILSRHAQDERESAGLTPRF
jgi:hypothetical protein